MDWIVQLYVVSIISTVIVMALLAKCLEQENNCGRQAIPDMRVRCLKNGLGSNMGGDLYRWPMHGLQRRASGTSTAWRLWQPSMQQNALSETGEVLLCY